MTTTRISCGAGLPAGFPFSLATEANGTLYVSGTPALDARGTFAPGTFTEEADRAWASVKAIASAAGYSLAEFAYVQVLLADIGSYGEAERLVATPVSGPGTGPGPTHLPGRRAAIRGEDRTAGGRHPQHLSLARTAP